MYMCTKESVVYAMARGDGAYVACNLFDSHNWDINEGIFIESIDNEFAPMPSLLYGIIKTGNKSIFCVEILTASKVDITIHMSIDSCLIDLCGGIIKPINVSIGKHVLTFKGTVIEPGVITNITRSEATMTYCLDLHLGEDTEEYVCYPVIDGVVVPAFNHRDASSRVDF